MPCEAFRRTHHCADSNGDAPATIGVRHYVSVADGEKGNGDHPQRVQNVGVIVVVVPGTQKRDMKLLSAASCLSWLLHRTVRFIFRFFSFRITMVTARYAFIRRKDINLSLDYE